MSLANALARKAAQLQAERTAMPKPVTPQVPVSASDMFRARTDAASAQSTPEAKAGAQATAIMTAFDAIPVEAPSTPVEYIPEVRIERVLDRGRLDVYFSSKPSDRIRHALLDNGFVWHSSDLRWFHKDTEKNRFILTDLLGADFCEENAKDVMAHDSTAGVAVDKCAKCGEHAEYVIDGKPNCGYSPCKHVDSAETPEFERYRQQVDELIEHMQIRPADLMLLAIDALHKSTFGRN